MDLGHLRSLNCLTEEANLLLSYLYFKQLCAFCCPSNDKCELSGLKTLINLVREGGSHPLCPMPGQRAIASVFFWFL